MQLYIINTKHFSLSVHKLTSRSRMIDRRVHVKTARGYRGYLCTQTMRDKPALNRCHRRLYTKAHDVTHRDAPCATGAAHHGLSSRR